MERLEVIFKAIHNEDQNLETNNHPQSDTMSTGNPCFEKMWVMKCWASSFAVSVVLVEMKIACFISRHMTTRIESKVAERGRALMWSIEIEDQGHSPMGKGLRSP